MKFENNRLVAFVATFAFGCIVVSTFLAKTRLEIASNRVETSAIEVPYVNRIAPDSTAEIEKISSPKWEDVEADFADDTVLYSIDLLQVGSFHGDEVVATTGESWLALYTGAPSSHLERTEITVATVRDGILDDEKGTRTGKRVTVLGDKKPLFLLKNAKSLKPGKVTTIFDYTTHSENENVSMVNGFEQKIHAFGGKYLLKVVGVPSSENQEIKMSRLVLVSNGIGQTIRLGASENWKLLWAGDLDNDGKLDFYADLSDHYNASMPTLFLSSMAEKGELVKAVAGIRTLGC